MNDSELREVVRILFLHELGSPIIKPEQLSPKSPEAIFLRANPEELLSLAAETLDPGRETTLWRQHIPREKLLEKQRKRWEEVETADRARIRRD